MSYKVDFNKFLEELTELTKKHGIWINGCGCCGSPVLCTEDPETIDGVYEVQDDFTNLYFKRFDDTETE